MVDSVFSFYDATDEDSDDEKYEYMEDSSLPRDDEFLEFDGFDSSGKRDSEDYDDTEDYEEVTVGKKRRRTGTDAPRAKLSGSKQINARINAHGGEAFLLEESVSLPDRQQNPRALGTFGRRDRHKNKNLPAYHKKVSAELDPDDKLMLQMRENGYSDRQIAEKLAEDGHIRYDQKSISTRIMRVRLAQAEKFDFLLQEGYKEWRFEDDQRLVQAYALADIEVSYEIERIRAWRFRKVSEYMRRLDSESLFSATACRIRYGELTSGTARIPCDIDDDPDARREEFEEFRRARETARKKEAAELRTREAMEKRIKNAEKIKNAQKAEEAANKRAAKEQAKAQRAMQRAAQAQLRMQQAADNQRAMTVRNAQIKEAALPANKRNKKDRRGTDTCTKPASSKSTSSGPPKATTEDADIIDPRSYLSLADLTHLCTGRGLPTNNKTKKALVAALTDADMEWTHAQLRKMCKSKGLNAGGSKAVMRYQLALKAAQMCPSFEAGMKAAEGKGDRSKDSMTVDVE